MTKMMWYTFVFVCMLVVAAVKTRVYFYMTVLWYVLCGGIRIIIIGFIGIASINIHRHRSVAFDHNTFALLHHKRTHTYIQLGLIDKYVQRAAQCHGSRQCRWWLTMTFISFKSFRLISFAIIHFAVFFSLYFHVRRFKCFRHLAFHRFQCYFIYFSVFFVVVGFQLIKCLCGNGSNSRF